MELVKTINSSPLEESLDQFKDDKRFEYSKRQFGKPGCYFLVEINLNSKNLKVSYQRGVHHRQTVNEELKIENNNHPIKYSLHNIKRIEDYINQNA